MGRIVIDPLTRIEGHLKIEVEIEGGTVVQANSSGMLFRGLEIILKGRDPRDAQTITQRVCGVCPTPHAMAAALNLDSAFGIDDKIPDNGRIIRNLILGASELSDHVLHFYHLSSLDYVDVTKIKSYEGKDPFLTSIKNFINRGELSPFVPRYEGDYRLPDKLNEALVSHYIEALNIRRKGQEMVAIFGGKMPHNVGILPGGVASIPTPDNISSFLWRLKEIKGFIENVYLPDVIALAKVYSDYFEIGKGCGRLLSFGVYDLEGKEKDLTKRKRFYSSGRTDTSMTYSEIDPSKIAEYVKYSFYEDSSTARHPKDGITAPKPEKAGAYSWLKSPRYDGMVYEVGPLARIMVNYAKGNEKVRKLVDSTLSEIGVKLENMFSTMGRHLARALETKLLSEVMEDWVLSLKIGEPCYVPYEIPEESEGIGLLEAARGALCHAIRIKEGKIENYQVITPSTWNVSPKDDKDQPGALEQALIGTKIKDEKNPFEIVRIVRSFDPCLACSIHLIDARGKERTAFRIT
ncbi:MAG: nickel-dependent hydrogenase large subunit [Desulfobacterota bacterium]|nr:nickel-dependent hydrogenase large subunit [Thermodesulfobacteriota bacterium]MDW8001497.1 nickel-dependent hydrogenase large subunit [Deltaproteobacteria bacterium]